MDQLLIMVNENKNGTVSETKSGNIRDNNSYGNHKY
jgi:hypothetical protein